jgi:phosphohistidine phosphatase
MSRSLPVKHLLLLRHAHAEAGSADGSDFSRPLTEEGRKEAKRVGKFMRHAGIGMDAILSSSSRRTLETVEFLLKGAKLKVPLNSNRAIYNASAEEILHAVRMTDDALSRVLVVGHNPGVADFLALLTSRESALSVQYPPATLALMEFESPWSGLAAGRAMLRWMVPVKLMV